EEQDGQQREVCRARSSRRCGGLRPLCGRGRGLPAVEAVIFEGGAGEEADQERQAEQEEDAPAVRRSGWRPHGPYRGMNRPLSRPAAEDLASVAGSGIEVRAGAGFTTAAPPT